MQGAKSGVKGDMTADAFVIETHALQKRYGGIVAVNDLSLQVRAGDIYGVLGPNGSGKSTTLRLLLGLVRPDAGSMRIFGLPFANHRNAILRRVGAFIDKPDFYEYLSAYHNLSLLSRLSGLRPQRQHLMASLEQVGLATRAHSKVRTFSQGMRQRLGIAQALLHDPELLILDEPTNGLDPQGVADVRMLILGLNQERGKTVLLSSHLLQEVERMATHVLVLDQGRTVVTGTVNDLLGRDTARVRLQVDEPEVARRVIDNPEQEIQVLQAHGGDFLLAMALDQVPRLNCQLVQAGVTVRAIMPIRSLEEYFLRMT
jgi:ABC-type multidrug transport system ATPase subunit